MSPSQALTSDGLQGACEARLLFGGDTCPVGRGAQAIQLGPEAFWPEIAALFHEHHVAMVNLETPLVPLDMAQAAKSPFKSGPVLTGSLQFAGFLEASGVTAVSLANNHVMDAGVMALESTIEALERAGIRATGAGPTLAAAEEPLVVPTPAGAVGIICVAEGEFSAASPRSGGAAPLHEASVVARLRDLLSSCALAIVICHGGNEHYPLPSPEMVRRCHAFVDAGAAAVICHHTHVVSGCEEYHGGVVAYGLGNLLFDWPTVSLPSWNTGALISLRVRAGRIVDWRLHGTEQDMTVPVVRLVRDRNSFESQMARTSAVILDHAQVVAEFRRFCHSSRELYLFKLLGLNKIERRLVRWGINPRWRFRRNALLGLLNTIECESHSEAAAEVLREELGLSAENQPDPRVRA
jgi:hypothetical protein